MHMCITHPGRTAIAVAAAGIASAALALGATVPALAATGDDNGGIRSLQLSPTAPATNFAAAGTGGTLRFNAGDGAAPGTVDLAVGDAQSWTVTLPAGLQFAADPACTGTPITSPTMVELCVSSNDNRTRTLSQTMTVAESRSFDYNTRTVSWPIITTGVLSGDVTAAFTPWPGTTSTATSAAIPQAAIPGAGTPFAATGASGPDANGVFLLTGTAQPTATILVRDTTGTLVGTGTADSTGNWSVTIAGGATPPLLVVQRIGTDTAPPLTFDTAPLPMLDGTVASGLVALVVLGFGGLGGVRRVRRPETL